MSLTLPLTLPARNINRDAPGLRAKVIAIGCGHNPVTCEVVTTDGQQHTIWLNGHHVGDVVALERRMSSSGPYWSEVGYSK